MKSEFLKSQIRTVVFESKWLLTPFYVGLVIAQVFYCVKFCQEVFELSTHFWSMDESAIMVAVLTLIDITMVANLLKMIISGSYQCFVEKNSVDQTEKVSSGLLKVKMGSSLVGISSIHLLRIFINPEGTNRDLIVKASIHLIFLVSTLGLAYIDYLHHKTEEHP